MPVEKDAQAKPAPEAAKTETEKVEKDEAWWRARIGDARDTLRRDEVLLGALQARVNGLTSEFVGRDDPYQRAAIGEDRRMAIVELDRLSVEVSDLKKRIEEIEEEARKANVPPGWLR
jgi:transposase